MRILLPILPLSSPLSLLCGSIPLLGGLGHQVQCATSPEETDLGLVESVRDLDLFLGTVLVGDLDVKVLARGELVQAKDGDLVSTGNLVVVGWVFEPKRKETLLLAVTVVIGAKASISELTWDIHIQSCSRLVDTGEGSGNNSTSTKESGPGREKIHQSQIAIPSFASALTQERRVHGRNPLRS